jgi:hypothetical protein
MLVDGIRVLIFTHARLDLFPQKGILFDSV